MLFQYESRGFNSYPGQSVFPSLCEPISMTKANAHIDVGMYDTALYHLIDNSIDSQCHAANFAPFTFHAHLPRDKIFNTYNMISSAAL